MSFRSRWRLHRRNMSKPSCAPWACARCRCRPVPGKRASRALGAASGEFSMSNRYLVLLALSALGSGLCAQTVAPQPPTLRQVSLEDAIRLADRTSETVEIARAAVTRANGQQLVARSQFLP